jgi:hypothetical protein
MASPLYRQWLQCRQRVRHGAKVTLHESLTRVTHVAIRLLVQNTELTFCTSSIMGYFCLMSLPWLAAHIFLLTTQRITQHIYWNVFVQYNLIWGLGMADGHLLPGFWLKMMSSLQQDTSCGTPTKWIPFLMVG